MAAELLRAALRARDCAAAVFVAADRAVLDMFVGTPPESDWQAAVDELRRTDEAADADPWRAFAAGLMHELGLLGQPVSRVRAGAYYYPLVMASFCPALVRDAGLTEAGAGAATQEWAYRRAAELGYAEGMACLAVHLQREVGVSWDANGARQLMREAARTGLPAAASHELVLTQREWEVQLRRWSATRS